MRKGGKKMTKQKLTQQANEIKRIAEESGVQGNFFFLTTFDRYLQQIRILDKLEPEVRQGDVFVKKTYNNGKENDYINPAITEYNRTTDSANKTLSTLLKIIRTFAVEESTAENDPLLAMINGSGEGDE